MKWNEGRIARAIALQTLARKCVVLVPNCNWTGHECDVLAVTTDLRIIDIEVNISRSDFRADAGKDKWWKRVVWARHGPPHHLDWPQKVWKHYVAMPAAIWDDSLFEAAPSPATGILLVREQRGSSVLAVECVRRAKPNKDASRLTCEQVVDIARLANLRMWEAYRAAQQDQLYRAESL